MGNFRRRGAKNGKRGAKNGKRDAKITIMNWGIRFVSLYYRENNGKPSKTGMRKRGKTFDIHMVFPILLVSHVQV